MNRIAVLFTIIFVLSGVTPAGADVVPTLSTADFIHWGPEQRVVEVEFNGPMANVGDWNGDGVKDLLVGVYQDGAVYYYPNSGTNTDPVFDERLQLYADGNKISVPYG